ncbi:GNAT family N-acetyltransferase [Undibacterium sp. Ren11W]|uniref:GNAT family N-acetyltransferase n=1 Tax=Undibacterium sp. Ren11W TaxID=3413045 RepID=UPI003BF3916C
MSTSIGVTKDAVYITFEAADQPDVLALIAELDVYQHTLYPPASVYALDLVSVQQEQLLLAVARDAQGVALGCGALLLTASYGELKRMYVSPGQRGRGIATSILVTLENAAKKSDCRQLMLETGTLQPQAQSLYAQAGYSVCAAFGGYPEDAYSVFMQKRLDEAA